MFLTFSALSLVLDNYLADLTEALLCLMRSNLYKTKNFPLFALALFYVLKRGLYVQGFSIMNIISCQVTRVKQKCF
jgi:hypothetical protein